MIDEYDFLGKINKDFAYTALTFIKVKANHCWSYERISSAVSVLSTYIFCLSLLQLSNIGTMI